MQREMRSTSAATSTQSPSLLARALPAILALMPLTGCMTLQSEPWYQFRQGSNSVSLYGDVLGSSETVISAKGVPGGLFDGSEGKDKIDLDTEYLVGGEMHHWVTDKWTLGGGLSFRRYDLEEKELVGLQFSGESFESLVWSAGTRYYFEPFKENTRWRTYIGLDMNFTDSLDIVFTVEDEDENEQFARFEGDGYFGTSLICGAAVLMADDTYFYFGAAWEQAFRPSNDIVDISPALGEDTELDMDVELEGLNFFFGLTLAF